MPLIKLTDRRPDDDVMRPTSLEQSGAQTEAESGAAVRVERFVRRGHEDWLREVGWRSTVMRLMSKPESMS